MENYIIIHGSFGSPFDNWFPWLHSEISKRNKNVLAPAFPIGNELQNYKNWSGLLDCYTRLGYVDENTTFIAHSIAPIFVIHYLLEKKIKVKKLIFVAGFNQVLGIDPGYDTVNKTFFCDEEELSKIHEYCDDITCIYSNNDPYLPYEKLKDFAKVVADKEKELKDAGHINSESGFDRVEEIVDLI